jgi:hypothetical protein
MLSRVSKKGQCIVLIAMYSITCSMHPLFLVTLMMEALHSSETSVLTRAARRNIPQDGILHSNRRENLISSIALTIWAL